MQSDMEQLHKKPVKQKFLSGNNNTLSFCVNNQFSMVTTGETRCINKAFLLTGEADLICRSVVIPDINTTLSKAIFKMKNKSFASSISEQEKIADTG